MTASDRVHYTRLPGKRRGIIRGSSVWLGPDHLLLVRSWRFREEYKRFHMNDIQSIAVADAPRFHISTRSIGIAVLWLIALSIVTAGRTFWPEAVVWSLGAALVIAWIYVSAKCSCVCRIYTAVSGDDLPSVYRTWTVRKFMSRVEPHIVAAQGAIEGDWAEAIDARRIGPAEEVPEFRAPGSTAMAFAPQKTGTRSFWLSEGFVAMMFLDALYTFLTRRSSSLTWLGYSLLAVEIALSIALLIMHYRGQLRSGMQKVVIASILFTGVTWYSAPFISAISVAANANARRPSAPIGNGVNSVIQYIDVGAHVVLGLCGLGIVLAQREKKPRAIIEL
jgi:hypothetical protein